MADDGLTPRTVVTTAPEADAVPGLARRAPLRLWLAVRYRLTPWWVRVIVVFVLSRVITTGLLLSFAARQEYNAWTGAHPGYFDFANMWDANWYYIIAVSGYPSVVPAGADGHLGESAWAFMPAYPYLIRGLMLATGLDFKVLSVVVSFAFTLGAALLFYRLMRRFVPSGTALFSVVLFLVAPLSPILQVGYAESMHTFFLTLALYLLVQRRYVLLFPVIAVMSLTRPSGLAFALALGLHAVHRWWTRRRDPFLPGERPLIVGVTLFSAFMGVAWLLIAGIATGDLSTYTETELAWRAAYIGYGQLLPFTPWIQGAQFWLGQAGGTAIVVIGVIAIAGFFVFLFTPGAKRLGVDIRFWSASYALYLLAVFFPQSSTFRLLVPIFPLWGAVAQPRSWIYRLSIVLLCIAGQWGWIHIGWWVDGYDWTPP